jgi:2',3'-cyclic-nucleotide 2'-phosphodiesterase (5'-nucleotidase family)
LGGLAEISTIVRNTRPDLLLDAGDRFTGTFLNDEFEGRPIILAMNRIGFQAGAIGNHEFDYGMDALKARVKEANFPMLTANLETGVPGIQKYTVISAKGLRFGIIGLTLQGLAEAAHPDRVRGLTVQPVVKALEETLPEVRSKSDFIILVTHLDDEEERRIAEAFPDIRLIVGGHNHSRLGPILEGQTLIVKTGSSGRNIGRVDLEFDGKNLTDIQGSLIPVRDVPPDPEITALFQPFEAIVTEKMKVVIGEAAADITTSSKAESPLANLITDVFKEAGKTEIAFQNAGGIRTYIRKGPITWGEIFEVLPFQNVLFTLKLTGAQIKNTLNSDFIAVSGLRVRFDLTQPRGRRMVSATLANGQPLDDESLYTVTTNDFVVAGGDGFTEFANGKDIKDTGILLRDLVVEYVKARKSLTPVLDGRITP